MDAEFRSELHLLGGLLHLFGYWLHKKEGPGTGNGQQAREVISRRTGGVKAYGSGVDELVADVECILLFRHVDVNTFCAGFVLLHGIGDVVDRLTRAFRHALSNGQRSGELDAGADLDELASFFTMALVGVVALIRAAAPPEDVGAACRVAASMLDRHPATTL